MKQLIASLCLVFPLILGCNERTRDADIVVYSPGDGGVDAADSGQPDMGPRDCEGQEGSTCRLPRAFGVCLSGRCSLVACVSGFTDCDSDRSNGCEVEVDDEDSCGACGVTCAGGERCQLGTLGYVCSAEPVCESGQIDLDLRNGCEWSSDWAVGRSQPSFGYVPEILFERLDGSVWTAGAFEQSAAIAPLGEAVTELEAVPTPAIPVGIAEDDDELLVAWPGGISRVPDAGADAREPSFVPVTCNSEQAVVDVSISTVATVVATEHALLNWGNRTGCADCSPAGPRFDTEDYLAALWPGQEVYSFAPEEVAECTPCAAEASVGLTQAACHPDACRDVTDPIECADCDPTGCPDFDVVRVLQNGRSERVYVVTRRGLLVFSYRGSWQLVARFEEPFTPGTVQGRAFVDGHLDQDGDVITLLDNAGRVLTISFAANGSYESTAPAISVGSGRELFMARGVSMIRGTTDDFLVGRQGPSAAIHRLDSADGPAIASLRLLVAGPTNSGFLLLYEAQGLIFERRLTDLR